jgi:hypothetical protein
VVIVMFFSPRFASETISPLKQTFGRPAGRLDDKDSGIFMYLTSYFKCFVKNLIGRPRIGAAGVGSVWKLTTPVSRFDSAVVARGLHFLVKLFVIGFGRLWQFNPNEKARHK